MNRVRCATLIGGVVMAALLLLGRFSIATPIPFFLLLPGLIAGMCMPDAAAFKTNDPWGPLAMLMACGVNLTIYAGVAYSLLSLVASLGRKRGGSSSR